MALKNYKIVNCKPTGKLVYGGGEEYDLAKLTDEQAEKLLAKGSRYIEKVEKNIATTAKESKEK